MLVRSVTVAGCVFVWCSADTPVFCVCSLFAIPGTYSETVVWWRNDPDNLLSTAAGATLSARLLSCLFGLVFFLDGSALLSLLVYMYTERPLKHSLACARKRAFACALSRARAR